MSRKLLFVALGALAAAAVVSRRRRAQAPGTAPPRENGRPADAQESLRRFVEAGERLRGTAGPQ